MMICIQQVFYGQDEPDDAINAFVRAQPATEREGMAGLLIQKVQEISDADNRTMACRKWVWEAAEAYAPHRALFTAEASYEQDVDSGARHPHALGLREVLPQIVSTIFHDRLREEGSIDKVIADMRKESVWLHIHLHFANMGRIALNDHVALGDEEWYRPVVITIFAQTELSIREALGDVQGDRLQRVRGEVARYRSLLLDRPAG